MRFILSIIFCFTFTLCYAGTTQNPYTGELQKITDIQTEDGNTIVYAPETLKVTNGSLTDNGDGTASLSVPSISSVVSDIPYSATWDTVTTIAPSKNTIYDKIQTLQPTITAGRSLTFDSVTLNADPELYTDTKCIHWENPVATDDFKSIWYAKQAFTITNIWAESDQTVNLMLEVDDGTPASVDTVNLAPAAGVAEDTSLNGDTTMAAGDRLDLNVASVANTPTWCTICWSGTRDD